MINFFFVCGVHVPLLSGVAHHGEYVDLVREPRNPYDSNAIRVDNLARQQVGELSNVV